MTILSELIAREEAEDMMLLAMMKEVDRNDTISEEEVRTKLTGGDEASVSITGIANNLRLTNDI